MSLCCFRCLFETGYVCGPISWTRKPEDGNKGRIALRFIACGDDLVPHAGLMGLCDIAKLYSQTAAGIKSGTLDVIKSACTALANAPFKKDVGVHDMQLQDHILKHIELWNTDAAEDEVLAGKLLQGTRSGAGVDAWAAVHGMVRRARWTCLLPHQTQQAHPPSTARKQPKEGGACCV